MTKIQNAERGRKGDYSPKARAGILTKINAYHVMEQSNARAIARGNRERSRSEERERRRESERGGGAERGKEVETSSFTA